MHNVITNATRGDPYRIDTLMMFMANMAWNSTMNTMAIREMLNRKDASGEFLIPFLVVCDAFQSETVAFADLVLPDTTYLERHDVMGMLDRPISEFEGPVDSVRVPVVKPLGECKPFQEVLIELAGRLKFPAFTTPEGTRKFTGYPDFVVNFQPQPGIGFLMAGVAKMNFKTYAIYSTIGGIVWVTSMTLAGFFLGSIPVIKENIDLVAIGIVLLSLIPVAVEVIKHKRKN
jgi:anaerobic selenocysteine-containing dehydrogenase